MTSASRRTLAAAGLGLALAGLLGACGMEHQAQPMADAATMPMTAAQGSVVAFPASYQESFTHYATINRPDERKQVVKLFANDAALASAAAGTPLASGSVLVMEVYKAKLGADQQPTVGTDGLFLPDQMAGVAVMESRDGWGTSHPAAWRNGTWEYANFNPDGTVKQAELQKCFECHATKVGPTKDFLFSYDRLRIATGG